MKILLTGATGFVGFELVNHLLVNTDFELHLAVRKNDVSFLDAFPKNRVKIFMVAGLSAHTNWSEALSGCSIVIHAAARVHIMKETEKDPLKAFREINVDGTLNLAYQAAKAGVNRFIYLSSIKVNGEYTLPGQWFKSDDSVRPTLPYSVSKYEAELGLFNIANHSDMDVTIIRPPLVYGPGVKGNFYNMLEWLNKNKILPFGSLGKNKRSFISVQNLIDFITICIKHPNASNQLFLISDDHDLSTLELMQKIIEWFGDKIVIPIPKWVLYMGGKLLKQEELILRLTQGLQVDISKSKKLLNWTPVESVDNALYRTVIYYRNSILRN